MPVSRLKSLILLFVRLIARARGARIGKTQTDRPSTVTLAHAVVLEGLGMVMCKGS